MKPRKFPFYAQLDQMDCGPSCLRMIAKYYGKNYNINQLRSDTQINSQGVSLLGISQAAEKMGFKTIGVKITYTQLIEEALLPCIIHLDQNHFVVVTPKANNKKITVADPGKGIITYTTQEFLPHWLHSKDNGERTGIALLLEPTPAFYEQEGEKENKLSWARLFSYVKQHKRYIVQLIFGLLIGSLLQLVFPFLTQSIIDVGINNQNLTFIYIILIAQLMLFFSRTIVEFIRSRILLYISTRVNISILSDFWIKLMRLPLSFFDTKQTGDIFQRINDHHRIEQFLTGSALNTLFSVFSLIIFSIVLLIYDWRIFFIFAIGSIVYFLWIRLFLSRRRKLDYRRFALASAENSTTLQLIHGMQEIKLNNAEHLRRWEWEQLQASLFKLNFKSLSLNQYQQAGAVFINEGKNILITFFVATAVLNGQLTLGAMLAIQYIIGQLNSPIEQLIGFTQQAQDTKISLERLNEIHVLKDEEPLDQPLLQYLPSQKSIQIKQLSFTYIGASNEPVLKNINLTIPEGKTTAIVGMSGSGKTTLLKLLLKYYDHYQGEVVIGTSAKQDLYTVKQSSGTNLKYISPSFWRKQCGSVMQDGFIFSDTIAKNIAVGAEIPNYPKLMHACHVANILPFVESLPLGFGTKIGADGNGISQGQKQRILIARAVYKDPEYIFFDEATNALDANNEKVIMENLECFFKGKTVIVVAHRLSTVKHADNIVVLHQGEIIEEGNHDSLAIKQGFYYQLVKNQLELGS